MPRERKRMRELPREGIIESERVSERVRERVSEIKRERDLERARVLLKD